MRGKYSKMLFFMHNCFQNHVNGDNYKCKNCTNQPRMQAQTFDAKCLSAKSDEDKLHNQDGPHDQQEILVASNILKWIKMICTCVKAIEGNRHHEGCKQT